MKKRLIWGVASVILAVSLLVGLGACAKAPVAPGAAKTLKIALNIALNWPIGLDNQHAVAIEVEKINSEGGLQVGGDRYKIETILDDNKMDPALGKTAAQKEIFQDKVKFIQGDNFSGSFLALCDENKVLLVSHPATMEDYDPKFKYLVHGCINNTSFIAILGYGHEKFPNLSTFVGVLPDRVDGRTYGKIFEQAGANVGLKPLEMIYYPADQTDLSAVGTRVKTLNPDFLLAYGGGPQSDSTAMKAAYAAGWRGQLLGAATMPAETLIAIAGPDALEGIVAWAWPAEFDPAGTPLAADFKARYAAKYGKWDNPEVISANNWWTMLAGIQQAKSIDPDKVAAKIFDGMKFDSPTGACMMIPRPDYNNNKTIDLVINLAAKTIKGGKLLPYDTTTPQQMYNYVKEMYAFK